MRIGMMTGGGDAPGLNGVIEGAARSLLNSGAEVVGILDGFQGVFEERSIIITQKDLVGLHAQAGTFLGTTNRYGIDGREQEFIKKIRALKLDGLIAAGGDGTFRGLEPFKSEIPLIGVPTTIDNALSGTEITFGFDTACSVIAEAVDALRATANAHRRAIIVEAMGRTAGWIALGGGMASYADGIMIPEQPFDPGKLYEFIKSKMSTQRGFVFVVSEGAHAKGQGPQVARLVKDAAEAIRFGGIAAVLADEIEKNTGVESRHVVLGHLQRSRAPTTTDRFLTLAMGTEAARLALAGQWGMATVYREGKVIAAPVTDLMGPPRLISPDHRWLKMAKAVGIFI
ncbi:MAG: 6-phosphofructokinase [Bdellovibrionales bacterium]